MKPERSESIGAARLAMMLLAGALAAACGKKEATPRAPGLSGGDTSVLQSTARLAFSNQGTVRLAERSLADTLAAPARIEADERLSSLVVAPASGRLEEVAIRTPEQWLRKGERIALLYSPELVAAQRDLLLLSAGDSAMAQAVEGRLRGMGFTAGQIRSIRASGKPMERIPITSPRAGYALARPAAQAMAAGSGDGASAGMGAGMGDGMGATGGMGAGGSAPMPEAAPETGEPPLRAGMSVVRGTVLARINDLSRVAVLLSLPVRGAASFRAGDSVHLDMPSIGFAGAARLDFLESRVVDSSGNVQATAYLPNPGGRLRLGSLGVAHVATPPDTAWVLPDAAIHALGDRHIVWARSQSDSGLFEAREVRIGRAAGGYTEIVEGLAPGSSVAMKASLLVDPDVVLEPLLLGAASGPDGMEHADHGSDHQAAAAAPGSEHEGHGTPGPAAGSGASEDHGTHAAEGQELRLTADKARLAGIRTAKADSLMLVPSQVFRAILRLDDRSQAAVPARVEGRFVQSAVLRAGERVRTGQVLAYLESETFQAAQEEFLAARRSASAMEEPGPVGGQVQAARRRLEVMGMAPGMLAGLAKDGKVRPRMPVHALRSGILIGANAQPGQYVQSGQVLFTVGQSDKVWVETWLLANEAAAFPEGTEAAIKVEGIAGGDLTGRLDHVRSGTTHAGSAILAHIGLPNPEGRLLPGMQAWVTFRQPGRRVLSVPSSALVPGSKADMVWVETGRLAYSPRMVKAGERAGENLEILEGLGAGENVVVSGAYLLNSEFIIRKGAGNLHAGH